MPPWGDSELERGDIESYLIPNATYEEQAEYVEFKKLTDKSKYYCVLTLKIIEKLLAEVKL